MSRWRPYTGPKNSKGPAWAKIGRCSSSHPPNPIPTSLHLLVSISCFSEKVHMCRETSWNSWKTIEYYIYIYILFHCVWLWLCITRIIYLYMYIIAHTDIYIYLFIFKGYAMEYVFESWKRVRCAVVRVCSAAVRLYDAVTVWYVRWAVKCAHDTCSDIRCMQGLVILTTKTGCICILNKLTR